MNIYTLLIFIIVIINYVYCYPYDLSTACSTIYNSANQYDCAHLVGDGLNNVDSHGGLLHLVPSNGCSNIGNYGSCYIRICRSPDTRNNNKISAYASTLVAFTSAEAIIGFCDINGQVNGRITHRYIEIDGKPQEVDIYLSGANTSGRKLLQNIIIPRNSFMRKLTQNNDVNMYIDNGYICIQRHNSPWIVRRETFFNTPNLGHLGDERPAEEVVESLEQQVTRAVNTGSTIQRIGADVTIDQNVYNANMYMLPREGYNYVGDMGHHIVYNDHGDSEAAYLFILYDIEQMLLQENLPPQIPRQNGILYASFGIYSVQDNFNQRPSNGAVRVAGVNFQEQVNQF